MELCRKKEVSERMEVCKMDAMLVVDSYKKNAYSDKVSFDINPRMLNETPSSVIVKSQDDYNPEVCIKKTPSQEWELDVRPLISTKKWLQNYGLHKNKLTFAQILPVIGFKMAEDFDPTLKRPVSSRYAEGRFHQLMRPDGKMFNVTCGREKLRQLDARLQQAIHLYKRRLEWLTTESRRVFGVIEERAITIVLDIRNMSPQQFDLYRMALERVIYEQITQIAKFNLIRASDDIKMYQDHCVPVTHDTIEMAIKWLWGLDRLGAVSSTACVESMLRAFEDKQNEAVYLFTEGSSVDTCRQLLKEKVASVCCKPPVNVVSYNCENSDTVRFLREFAESAKGKIHVYAIIMEMDSFEGLPVDPNTNKANILLKKKTFGGIPPGAGVREDVILLFQQMEEARNNLLQIQKLITITPEPNVVLEAMQPSSKKELGKFQFVSELAPQVDSSMINEQYMSSCHWLAKYGLGARKLELYDALAAVAFHHRDGVVDLQTHPGEECQTDALRFKKLVNAKYCDRFPVVRWKDGKVVHVQVTPELHRTYEQKVLTALRAIQSRIDWLNQGSRALFGTLIEDQVYILIDTSESMVPSIQYVKDKLFLLMQEQLRHKMKFNLTAFNSKAQVWQNRLVEVTETSLEGAWRWIQGLSCWGSTNTYAALQHALSDPGTQAIYLLTDGRPDQPPKSIIAQVQMQHSVPVHTISFNCNDTEANIFLHDLAVATGGRYHYFSDKGCDPEGQPESFESEDIRLLKEELSRGLENLDRVAELRDECSKLSWKKGIDELKSCSRAHPLPGKDRVSAVPAMEPQELYRSHTPTPPPRPGSAPPDRSHTPTPPPPKVTTSVESRSFTMAKRKTSKTRPSSARGSMKPLAAGHTRTSLLRTLNSQGSFDPEEWLLPETKQLFEKQATRQKRLAQGPEMGQIFLSDGESVLEENAMSPRVLDIVEARERHAFRGSVRRFSKLRTVSSKEWLKKNSLVAKQLTLLDALAPTLVTHKAKYVPILDKHVMAKVFDEILPIAHVSNKSRRSIKLINPQGVNLKAYEERLLRQIDIYNRRLDALVWGAVPRDLRDEEFGEEKGPVSFLNNRIWFMKALEEAQWPISSYNIILLEEEIGKAERFLQQSRDLRNITSGNKETDELSVYSDRGSVASGLSNKSKELSKSKESVSSSGSSSSSGSTSTARSKTSKCSKRSSSQYVQVLEFREVIPMPSRKYDLGVVNAEGDISVDSKKMGSKRVIRSVSLKSSSENIFLPSEKKRNYIFEVSKSPRSPQYQVHCVKSKPGTIMSGKKKTRKRTEVIPEQHGGLVLPEGPQVVISDTESQDSNASLVDYEKDMVGLRVIACDKRDGLYYPGHVTISQESAFAMVTFAGDRRQKVRSQMIIPMSGAIPRPELRLGDFVLVQVTHPRREIKCYVPGIIEVTPRDFQSPAKFYTILLYNAQRATTMRRNIVKIGRERFEMAVNYIAHVQHQKQLRMQASKQIVSMETTPCDLPDDSSSVASSKSSRSYRKKKQKITQKLSKKSSKGRSRKPRSESESSRSSRSRSKSSNSSRSSSRSCSGAKSRAQPGASRSRSHSSRSRSRSDSGSRSYSSTSRSRSRSRSSSSRSRSRSRSQSSERGRSRNRSRSWSGSSSTLRSRSQEKGKKSHAKSRSSSDNTTPRGRASPYARPESPVPKARPKSPPLPRTASVVGNVTRSDMYSERTDSRHVNVDEKEEIIQHLQSQLEKQKRKQFRQERRLVRQARKINKINKKLKEGEFSSQNISQESRISQYSEKSVTRSQFTSSSDTDMTPGRRKTSPDGTSFKETSNIRGSSHQNDDIYEHEEVLARWTDDGWWYRGRVEGRGEDETYVVVDATGYSEQMARDDILSENQHKFEVVQPQDFVIAPHPKYVFSFAPGEVLQTYANQNVKVEFYDGNIADLPSDGVYRVSKAKYNQTVDYIKRKEKDLHGKSVVARDDSTGVYKLGVVDSRVGLGQQYYICWLDGDMSKQNGHHIFEVGQRQGRHNDWDFVLAPVDDRKKVFLPATVAYSSPFTVEFCNGKSSSRVKRDQCFWLNQEYYRNAVEFYRSKNT
ncbi:von Willebrand factor A domain-containing protein 3B-like [Mya arenaria]|uniref:von Willebrand factor A domain-containing protein 3B-like n=1 Tax=Mya arenaria TaxID=6604 RepID=UPI0022E7BB85|nr:von Willebrand factor A domain-containing protein 3B-like [Mya arenaria]